MRHCPLILFVIVSVLSSIVAVNLQGDEPAVLEIGNRRELFVDGYLIDRLDGAELRLHRPHREAAALKFDKPWEGVFSGYTTVIKDGDLYRMYYRGLEGHQRRGPLGGQAGAIAFRDQRRRPVHRSGSLRPAPGDC